MKKIFLSGLGLAFLSTWGFCGSHPIVFRTLDKYEASQFLKTADDYTNHLSLLDRSVRLKTPRDVSNEEYLTFVSEQALSWEETETENIQKAAQMLNTALMKLEVSAQIPSEIYVIKTTGQEESNSAYTRGNAIILPHNVLTNPLDDIVSLFFHEFFHVFNRFNPKLCDSIYNLLGFNPFSGVEFPKNILDIMLTNPDATHHQHFISVYYNGDWITVVPLIVLSIKKEEITDNLNFFNYLYLRLLKIKNNNGQWQPAYSSDGKPILLVSSDTDYRYQVSQNTHYIIHPEEIMADNFKWLMRRELKLSLPMSVNNPKILDDLKNVLRSSSNHEKNFF